MTQFYQRNFKILLEKQRLFLEKGVIDLQNSCYNCTNILISVDSTQNVLAFLAEFESKNVESNQFLITYFSDETVFIGTGMF